MSEINVIAVLKPAPGKVERLKEVLTIMAKAVHAKEDYAVQYMLTEQVGGGETPDIIMIERYKSQEGADKHNTEPHFAQLMKTGQEEGLMAEAPYIVQTKTVTGFDLDHKFI